MRKETMTEICSILRNPPIKESVNAGSLFNSYGDRPPVSACVLGCLYYAKGVETLTDAINFSRQTTGTNSYSSGIMKLYPGTTQKEAWRLVYWFDTSRDSRLLYPHPLSFADIAALIEKTMLDPEDIPLQSCDAEIERELVHA